MRRSEGKWSDTRHILMVELPALSHRLDIEDEGGLGFYPELLSDTIGPLTVMKTGRGAVLRTQTKIFIYSFNKYLLSPYYVLCTVPSLRNTTVNKLG